MKLARQKPNIEEELISVLENVDESKKQAILGAFTSKKYSLVASNLRDLETSGTIDNIDDFENGTFIKVPLSDSDFSRLTQNSDDYKHVWTLDEIIQYFVGIGFDSTTASNTAAWLTSTVEHGEVLARNNPYIYMIVK